MRAVPPAVLARGGRGRRRRVRGVPPGHRPAARAAAAGPDGGGAAAAARPRRLRRDLRRRRAVQLQRSATGRSRRSSTAWSAELRRLLDEVVARDFPFFGACYGVGTLGVHQGGVDRPHLRRADLRRPGPADRRRARGPGPRRDARRSSTRSSGTRRRAACCRRRAVLLASSAACPVQMFRVKQNLYATQFHPELDLAGLITRVRVYQHAGYFPPEELDELIARLWPGRGDRAGPDAGQFRRPLRLTARSGTSRRGARAIVRPSGPTGRENRR